MSDSNTGNSNTGDGAPKKIAPEQVQVIGEGIHAHHSAHESNTARARHAVHPNQTGASDGPRVFSNVKVFQGGPLSALVLAPLALIMLPLLLLAGVFLLFFALFFGARVFRVFKVIKFKS